jgi:peptidyl-tRNA hydrolase, PTH1 family
MPPIRLVIGLGNPGKEYARTRHNAGFMVLDLLAERWGAGWKNWQGRALVAAKPGSDPSVLLVKPQTYMNNSGLPARELAAYHRIPAEDILAVIDDFCLPLGTLRLRRSGSGGGHNGLDSLIEHLNTSAFPRLRLGIGPVPPRIDPADFVLSLFPSAEETTVRKMTEEAAEVVENIIATGFDAAASRMSLRAPEPGKNEL